MKEQAGQKGFHAVTVDELAAAAGVSKRTLYRRFKSKDEVIAAVLDDLTAGIERRAQEIIAGTAAPPGENPRHRAGRRRGRALHGTP